MVKVLEHGNAYRRPVRRRRPPLEKKTFLCTACWCRFEADAKDAAPDTSVSGFMGAYPYACGCPECGKKAYEVDYK